MIYELIWWMSNGGKLVGNEAMYAVTLCLINNTTRPYHMTLPDAIATGSTQIYWLLFPWIFLCLCCFYYTFSFPPPHVKTCLLIHTSSNILFRVNFRGGWTLVWECPPPPPHTHTIAALHQHIFQHKYSMQTFFFGTSSDLYHSSLRLNVIIAVFAAITMFSISMATAKMSGMNDVWIYTSPTEQ